MAVYKAKAKFEVPKPKPFTIFYDDGSTWSWKQGPAIAARKSGVVCIVEEKTIHPPSDFYVQTIHGWVPCNTQGLIDYVTNRLGQIGAVMAGCPLPADLYQVIYQQAEKCRDSG